MDEPIDENENRGFRVRVVVPALQIYRYLNHDPLEGWYLTSRKEGRRFLDQQSAEDAIRAFERGNILDGFSTMLEPILSFDPDWVTRPGSHIEEQLSHKNFTWEYFKEKTGLNHRDVKKLLDGQMPISEELASKLEDLLGPSRQYWLNLDAHYQDGLRKGLMVV